MFKTKKRPVLHLPIITDADTSTGANAVLLLQYVTPAERNRLMEAHTVKRFYVKPIRPDVDPMLQPTEYIERDERDNVAILIAISKRAIVGWENVRDDDTGELIPFSTQQLHAFLNEGGEFTQWCMKNVIVALNDFDELVNAQQMTDEKNSSGLSASPEA